MAQNKVVTLGPFAFSASAANIISPPTLTGGTNPDASTNTFYLIRRITLSNTAGTSSTVRLYKGVTTGSESDATAIVKDLAIAANSPVFLDFPNGLRLASNDTAKFITGLASATTTNILIVAEHGIL